MNSRTFIVLATIIMVTLSLVGNCAGPMDQAPAINDLVNSYVAAFNKGDAGAATGYWSQNAQYIPSEGDRIKGRANILKGLEKFFEENKGAELKVTPKVTLFISQAKAVQRGVITTKIKDKPNQFDEYTCVFTKETGTWKIAEVEEKAIASLPTYEHLENLAWLIGDWVDEGPVANVETSFKWTDNRSFIYCSFKVISKDAEELEGFQVIGWDPLSGKIKSWMFDSKAGIGEGIWSKVGDSWEVSMVTTLPDGQRASAINIYRPDGPEKVIWKSTGRELAGKILPDIGEITIVRKADNKSNNNLKK